MYRYVLSSRLLERARRSRAERVARRTLERELGAYSSLTDRNDLEILVAHGGAVGSQAAAILTRQAGARLSR